MQRELYATTLVDGAAVPAAQFLFAAAHGHGFGGQAGTHRDAMPAYVTAPSWDEMPLAMPRDPLGVHLAYPASCIRAGNGVGGACSSLAAETAAGVTFKTRVYPYTHGANAPPLLSAVRASIAAPSPFVAVNASERVAPPMSYAARIAAEDRVKPMGH